MQHFSTAAPVVSVRVCRNALTRESLGYAYVNFQTAADAEKAMNELAYTPIKGRPCRIMWSQRDPSARRSNVGNIFIKNLSSEVTSRDLNETFKLFGNILSCKVATTPKGESKGYAFVHFETEESAKNAISEVNGMQFGTRNVEVLPYVAKAQRSGAEWTNIYVKNIPKGWAEEQLKGAFTPFGEILSAVVNKDESGASRGFGFVCFKEHAAASSAVDAMNLKEVDGEPATLPPGKTAPAPKEGEAPTAAGKVKLWVGRAQKKSERERALREKLEAAKRERMARMQGCNLFVRNLDESVDDAKLKEVFTPFGTITSAVVARETDGRSKLHGFVCFSSSEEASKALQGMHHKLVQGKPLWVALWQSKEQRAANLADTERRRTVGSGARGAAGAPNAAGGLGALAGAMGGAGGLNPAMAAMAQAGGGLNPMVMLGLMQQMLLQNAAAGGAAGGNTAALAQMQQFQALVSFMMQQQAAMGRNAAAMQQQAAAMGGARPGVPAGGARLPGGPGPAGAPNALAAMLGGFNQAQVQQLAAASVAGGVPQGQAGRGNRRGAPGVAGGPGSPTNGVPTQQMGGARVAAGPAAGAARGPMPSGAPAGARGAAPVPGARPGAAPVPGAAPAQTAMLPTARNQPAPAGGAPAVPAAPAAAGTDFASQLAQATPEQRKNMIGERLYGLISRGQPEKAGKITGMLLDGMDDGELLHLLESQADLQARVREALDVLAAHQAQVDGK